MKLPTLATIVAATLAASAAARAPALQDCRAIPDPEARLVCYDRMENTKPPPAPPPEGEETRREETPPSAAEEAEEIAAVDILRIQSTPTGRHRFVLANGEVWEQIEARTSELREGDKVSIRPGLFGGWNLREHQGAGRSHRVRRVE